MSKKIILLSDGTGNSAAQVWRTNVWRMFQAIDLKGDMQIAAYDDGVGTSSFLPWAILGGAFGVGLQRNVIELYKFLCRNYQSGDQIYGFGFSRGAFTIRLLIGLVLDQGLVNFADEAELHRNAKIAYRAYRRENDSPWNLQYPFRLVRVLYDRWVHKYRANQRPITSVEFLGLWDTVAAYGLPIVEMTRGVDKWLWPLALPDQEFNPAIKKARHALAIDEERQTFYPVLWNENSINTKSNGTKRSTDSEQLLQVWFSGVHSNVGGGYPDDAMANVSLAWMLAEAKATGLVFKDLPDAEPDALLSTDAAKDKDGRLYDSRSGLGGYYRYGPRRIEDFYASMQKKDAKGKTIYSPVPKIHESAFKRIKNGAHFYAPIGLPDDYEIVTTTDVILSLTPPPPLETVKSSVGPNVPTLGEGSSGAKARCAHQESVWDTVWRKRGIYFLTVFATGYLLTYPLYRDGYDFQEHYTPLRLVSDAIRLVGTFVPRFFYRWLDAYARDPFWFVACVALVVFLTMVGSRLVGSINDRMRAIWTAYLPMSNKPPITRTPSWPITPYVVGILWTVPVLYLFCYRWLGNSWLHWSGWLQLPSPYHEELLLCTSAPIRYVLIIFLGIYVLDGRIVRRVRQSPAYQGLLQLLRAHILPAASALGILYLAITVASHYLFDLRDSFGEFCHEKAELQNGAHGFSYDARGDKWVAHYYFDTSSGLCSSTGVFVRSGGNSKYIVAVTRVTEAEFKSGVKRERGPDGKFPQPEQWTFAGEPSYMGGQPIGRLTRQNALILALLYPLRRTLDRPWGNIILRVGSTGSDEDFLDRTTPEQSEAPQHNYVQYDATVDTTTLSENFKPKRDGELFIYLNRPQLALWGYESAVADWVSNKGWARVDVTSSYEKKSDPSPSPAGAR
jgi:uncharacterized protein (DUF2235 family)